MLEQKPDEMKRFFIKMTDPDDDNQEVYFELPLYQIKKAGVWYTHPEFPGLGQHLINATDNYNPSGPHAATGVKTRMVFFASIQDYVNYCSNLQGKFGGYSEGMTMVS